MKNISQITLLKKSFPNTPFIISAVLFLSLSACPFSFMFARNAHASGVAAEKEEITVLKNQIKLELKKLKAIEAKISGIKAGQKAKVKNLIAIYSSMDPRSAADILSRIDKSLAIYILSHMTARTASAIVSRMPVNDAVYFTDRIGEK